MGDVPQPWSFVFCTGNGYTCTIKRHFMLLPLLPEVLFFLFWGTLPFSWHEADGFHAEGFAAFPAQQARGSQSCLWLIFVSSQVLWQIDQLCVIKCCRQPLFLPEIRFLCEHYCKVNISSFSLCLWSASAADPTVGIVQAVSAAQTECCRLGRVKLPYALLLRRWWLCCWEEMVSAKPQSFH